jgi:hypothetical protein
MLLSFRTTNTFSSNQHDRFSPPPFRKVQSFRVKVGRDIKCWKYFLRRRKQAWLRLQVIMIEDAPRKEILFAGKFS